MSDIEAGGSPVGSLNVLPLFLNLKGRNILVAGVGAGILWKLQLLAATGAEILYIGRPDSEIAAWLLQADKVCWREGEWQEADFSDVRLRLAIGAFEQTPDAESFAASARAARVPVNLIDRPDLSDFSFGSIVHRGPVTIGISTNGAAPVLGQAIRQRMEAFLPSALGNWARAAQAARRKIAEALPDAVQRRRFWEHFSRMAFTRPEREIESVLQSAGETPCATGKVMLVGAGPGDSDSLTLKGLQALQAADVILSDDLISDAVLQLARREARRIGVGKRAGRASCRQDDINATMRDLARQGLQVVRLKSGDPSIFARASQEMAYLREADIEVEMIPGISLALAAAARLGVSLTDRDCARGVKFITAHSRHDGLPDLDWRACADPETTLIVYMGGRTAQKLARTLIAEGLSASIPVVVACDIAGANERFIPMQLEELAEVRLSVSHPVLIGIGQVFAACLEA